MYLAMDRIVIQKWQRNLSTITARLISRIDWPHLSLRFPEATACRQRPIQGTGIIVLPWRALPPCHWQRVLLRSLVVQHRGGVVRTRGRAPPALHCGQRVCAVLESLCSLTMSSPRQGYEGTTGSRAGSTNRCLGLWTRCAKSRPARFLLSWLLAVRALAGSSVLDVRLGAGREQVTLVAGLNTGPILISWLALPRVHRSVTRHPGHAARQRCSGCLQHVVCRQSMTSEPCRICLLSPHRPSAPGIRPATEREISVGSQTRCRA